MVSALLDGRNSFCDEVRFRVPVARGAPVHGVAEGASYMCGARGTWHKARPLSLGWPSSLGKLGGGAAAATVATDDDAAELDGLGGGRVVGGATLLVPHLLADLDPPSELGVDLGGGDDDPLALLLAELELLSAGETLVVVHRFLLPSLVILSV